VASSIYSTGYAVLLKLLEGFPARSSSVDHGAVMRLQGDHHYRWFHVFTGARSLWGEPAVAMEPMSAMADAYNNHDGLSVLIPGQTFEGTFSIGLWPEDQKL